MNQTTCSICIEPFNKSNKKEITCIHCNLVCCTSCIKTYFESSSVAPQCMQCHRPWTHQYIRETFGSTFVKKLADIQKNVLFTEQLTLIPYTQEYVNLVQRHESIKEREKEICEEIVQIQLERDNIFNKL